MADQVEIILRGNSKQLEASLRRINAGLTRLETNAVKGGRAQRTANKRTSKSIDNQNKSVTLLVAKFALLAFAIQTVANILNSTFGAALKSIDDFQVAAIGTATAVTNIADVSEDALGEAFNQNLKAALITFEKLELVAARFFSTGQELQLAFNTFAQRGVVIREDEFDILGKITDQVKLLTGGQNTQIQIQQEIRAILDGNVRTTTAFGKALQARGVDIAQLSREVRATGSIAPFEQFLTGLDAAGPAIRRTLSSVTATFKSLAAILNRRIFQDTFDTVVSQITDINNFIIDNLDLLVAMGKAIRDEVAGGLSSALEFADRLGGLILRIATSDIGRLILAITLLNKALRLGPIGAVLAIAAAFSVATEDAGTFGKVVNIAFNALEIALKNILPLFDTLLGKFDDLIRGAALIASAVTDEVGTRDLLLDRASLVGTDSDIGVKTRQLENREAEIREAQRAGNDKDFIDRLERGAQDIRNSLEESLKDRDALIKKIQANPAAEAFDFFPTAETTSITERAKKFVDDLDSVLSEINGNTDERTKKFSEQIQGLLKTLSESVDVVPSGGEEATFTENRPKIFSDTRIEEAETKLARAQEDARLKATIARVTEQEKLELASINKRFDAEEISATESFEAQNAIKAKSLTADAAAIAAAIELVRQRKLEDLAIIQRNIDADEGLTKIKTQEEAELKRLALNIAAQKQIGKLKLDADKIPLANDRERLRIAQELAKAQLEITLQIRKQQEALNQAFGSETNAQRAARTQAAAEARTTAFRQQNPGATNQQIIDNALQANIERIQANFKVQIAAFVGIIDTAFKTLIDGIVDGSFDFRNAAKTISRDLIKAGLDGLIADVKDTVVKGLTSLFDEVGQRAAQAATLALGLLIALLSRIGNEGEFTAAAGGGTGLDQGSAPVRGLIGGDSALPIAEINNGLQEALIPTNAILSQIELNTRPLSDLNLGIDPAALSQAITAQVQGLFSQALLQTP